MARHTPSPPLVNATTFENICGVPAGQWSWKVAAIRKNGPDRVGVSGAAVSADSAPT